MFCVTAIEKKYNDADDHKDYESISIMSYVYEKEDEANSHVLEVIDIAYGQDSAARIETFKVGETREYTIYHDRSEGDEHDGKYKEILYIANVGLHPKS